tara:strand:+ start:529 stop:735 length:207 start_codon:yes stop_codon:yes gene_type:complete
MKVRMMNKETNGYIDGDLVRVEGWHEAAILIGWQESLRCEPEFANVLYDGVIYSVHMDYMMKVREGAK